jgi:8-amino-7-oxononanoate synthase
VTLTDGLASYLAELEGVLDGLAEHGLRRRLRLPEGLDLASNDYLGLAEHPELVGRMIERLPVLGAGAGGSRLLRGHKACFAALEERLASFAGREAALLFGSGYAANTGLLATLVTPDDLVLSDERNHASLIDGLRLAGARKVVYPHQDLEAVERALRTASAPRPRRTFVVVESVYSMDGDLTPLVELTDLAERFGALLIVDEAHATGLYGPRGSGRVEELGLSERVLATIHTGGKALGSGGAWVAGPAALRETLLNRARPFVFSTAPLPVLSAALEAALDLLEREPERRDAVRTKAALLRNALGAQGADVGRSQSAIVPVIVGSNERALALAAGLAARGFDARAIRPPTVPVGNARLRLTARYPVADVDLRRCAAEIGRLLVPTGRADLSVRRACRS